jgi:excisionase family DNA binding protein
MAKSKRATAATVAAAAPDRGISDVADGVMSVKEACDFSKLSRTELYSLMIGGKLKYLMHGKRRLIPKRALIEMLAGKVVGGSAAA